MIKLEDVSSKRTIQVTICLGKKLDKTFVVSNKKFFYGKKTSLS